MELTSANPERIVDIDDPLSAHCNRCGPIKTKPHGTGWAPCGDCSRRMNDKLEAMERSGQLRECAPSDGRQ